MFALRTVFLCVVASLAGVLAWTAHPAVPVEQAPWEQKVLELHAAYNIAVTFDPLGFPQHWKAYEPHWTPLAVAKRMAALDALETDLSHYEPQFLRAHLSRVYIYESLVFMGTPYGGTTDQGTKSLYIQAGWLGDTGEHAHAMGFHHELSSLVLDLHAAQFPNAQWRAANQNTFTYLMEDAFYEKLHSGRTSSTGDETLYAAGFLCSYGQLALEEDVNTYAQYFIAKPVMLEELAQRYPLVRRKAQLLRDFYERAGFKRQPERRVYNQQSR